MPQPFVLEGSQHYISTLQYQHYISLLKAMQNPSVLDDFNQKSAKLQGFQLLALCLLFRKPCKSMPFWSTLIDWEAVCLMRGFKSFFLGCVRTMRKDFRIPAGPIDSRYCFNLGKVEESRQNAYTKMPIPLKPLLFDDMFRWKIVWHISMFCKVMPKVIKLCI